MSKRNSFTVISTILKTPVKSAVEGSFLTRLWRNIVLDLKQEDNMSARLNSYEKICNRNKVSPKKRIAKSTLISHIVSEKLSWSGFCALMFNVLRVKKFKITVKLTHLDDTETYHNVNVVPTTTKAAEEELKNNKGTQE